MKSRSRSPYSAAGRRMVRRVEGPTAASGCSFRLPFRACVKVAGVHRRVQRRRLVDRPGPASVRGHTRDVHDMGHTSHRRCPHDRGRAAHVDRRHLGPRDAGADERRTVDDRITTGYGRCQRLGVGAYVPGHDLAAGPLEDIRSGAPTLEAHDFVPASAQPQRHVRAQQPGPAGQVDAHGWRCMNPPADLR